MRPAQRAVTVSMAPEATNVRCARRFVAGELAQTSIDPSVSDDVLSVASELASNAVEHAGTRFSVSLAVDDHAVRLEVCDGSGQEPKPKRPSTEAARGRGLLIVDRLARRWGFSARPGGKCVWAEFS